MPSLTEIDGSMKALRNVTRIVVLNLPQLSLLSLRASLLSVNEVEMENAGLFEKSDELRERLKKTKRNEKGEKWLRFALSWISVVYMLSIVCFPYVCLDCLYHFERSRWCYYNDDTVGCILSSIGFVLSCFFLLCELHIKGLDAWLRRKCRFLFTYIGRVVCLLLK